MFEIRTPVLKQSIDAALGVISGLQNGSMEPRIAAGINAACRTVQSGVKTEIEARLQAPKIAAMEAKLVEAEHKAEPKMIEPEKKTKSGD